MMSLFCLIRSDPVYPVTERQIVREEYYQLHSCENLNTRTNFQWNSDFDVHHRL